MADHHKPAANRSPALARRRSVAASSGEPASPAPAEPVILADAPIGAGPRAIEPALGLLEFDSIAVGIEAGDAMAKRAPIEVILAGTVHPGKYLVLVGGAVADVEEAMEAGRDVADDRLVDAVLLPNVHPAVADALGGARLAGIGEALGVIETPTVAATIQAADAGVKGARVRLLELRLADGLGGKGYLLFDGAVSDVEAAVEIGASRIERQDGVVRRVIPQLHAEIRENLEAAARFGERARTSLPPPEPAPSVATTARSRRRPGA
jgi:bacterial microcompartment shell protein